MATDVQPQAKAAPVDPGRRPYRFTADQFWKMIKAGVFPESHVELVRGRIYLMTKYEPHGFTTRRMAKLLGRMAPEGFYARREESARHDPSSVLEPDVALVPGDEDVFNPDPPLTSEAVLVVEVCASTHRADYQRKLNLYAAAGVPTYWVVDVEGRKIDVFTKPEGKGREAAYADRRTFAEAEPAAVVVTGREVGRIAPRDVLPPLGASE